MPNAEATRLDNMMRKVEGLLAGADHPNTPPHEADAKRAMAEKIMRKYKIEQEDLLARGDLSIDGLNVLFKDVRVYPIDTTFAAVYMQLISCAISHTGCQGVWTGFDDGMRTIQIIGYEADIRYAEALYMNARLVFADRMEPKYDSALSDMENVYRMRASGMERIRVAEVMGWHKGAAKVTRLYKQACEARGEDPVLTGRGTDVVAYRAAYADGFVTEFWRRLYNARSAVDAEVDGGLVLHGREERIKEAMYERYPHLRPSATPARTGQAPVRRPTRWTKADERRAQRAAKASAQAGRAAGKQAASEVDVSQAAPKRRLNNN